MPGPLRRALLLVALGLGACNADADFGRLPDTDRPFFLIVHGTGQAPAITGPHANDEDQAAIKLSLTGNQRIDLLSVDLEQMLAPLVIDPSTVIDRVELRLESEPCEEGSLSNGGLRLAPNPALAQLYGLEDGQFTPRSLADLPLALWFPRDEASCFETPPLEFSSFGANESLLEPGPAPEGLSFDTTQLEARGVRLLSDGRVIVSLNSQALLLVEPGEDVNGRPGRLWTVAELPPLSAERLDWRFGSFEVSEADGGARLTVAVMLDGYREAPPGYFGSAVVDFEWTEAGFSPAVARILPEDPLRFIEIDDSGRWMVGGNNGALYLRAPGETDFQRVPHELVGLPPVRLRDWAPSGRPEEPDIFVDASATFLFGDLSNSTTFRDEPDPLGGFSGKLAIERSAAGLEFFWSAGTPQFRQRTASGERKLIVGYLPPELAACSDPPDACGRRNFTLGTTMPLAQTPHGTLLLASADCEAFIEYHPQRRCSRIVRSPGPATDAQTHKLTGFTATRDGLFVGKVGTRLYLAPWPARAE